MGNLLAKNSQNCDISPAEQPADGGVENEQPVKPAVDPSADNVVEVDVKPVEEVVKAAESCSEGAAAAASENTTNSELAQQSESSTAQACTETVSETAATLESVNDETSGVSDDVTETKTADAEVLSSLPLSPEQQPSELDQQAPAAAEPSTTDDGGQVEAVSSVIEETRFGSGDEQELQQKLDELKLTSPDEDAVAAAAAENSDAAPSVEEPTSPDCKTVGSDAVDPPAADVDCRDNEVVETPSFGGNTSEVAVDDTRM